MTAAGDAGANTVAYVLAPNVPARLYAAENDPAGCTIVNTDQAATVQLAPTGSAAGNAASSQPLPPLQSVNRRQGELYAVSAIACTVLVIEGQAQYAQIGTPSRQIDLWELDGAAATTYTSLVNTVPGDTFGTNRVVCSLTRTVSTTTPQQWTFRLRIPLLGTTQTLVVIQPSNGSTAPAGTYSATTDVTIPEGAPYVIEVTSSAAGNANDVHLCRIVPE